MTTAVVRADGSTTLGHGHIFRTLVLADELAGRGWQIHYVCRELPGAPLERVRRAGYALDTLDPGSDEVADARQTADIAKACEAEWIVVDRYDTDERAHALWSGQGLRLLAIDDLGAHPFDVEVLVNHNPDAPRLVYHTRPDSLKLLGTRYSLIHSVYRHHRVLPSAHQDGVPRILIFMGGSDPGDVAGTVLQALERVPRDLHVEVVVGSAYPYVERMERSARASRHDVRVLQDLPDLAQPMARADLAIAAGGGATWELACLGRPMLLLSMAENQIPVAVSMQARQAARYLGRVQEVTLEEIASAVHDDLSDPEKLRKRGDAASRLVDGLGPARVAAIVANAAPHAKHGAIDLRQACQADAGALFEIANDPLTRSMSFSSAPIPWDEHRQWFDARLASHDCLLLVHAPRGTVEAVVRFDMDGSEATISIALHPVARGQGHAASVIEAGVTALRAARPGTRIVTALVKQGNPASLRAFGRAAFTTVGETEIVGQPAVELLRVV